MNNNFVPLVSLHADGKLRVVILGRKSKPNPENENESIEASMEDAESYLDRIYSGPKYVTRLGEQISGMVVDRSTLRQLEDLVTAGEVDLVITEDIGRIFRNPRFMYTFAQNCADDGVRLISVADNIDTADDNWETAMGIAAIRHGFAVPDARRRVSRSAKFSFHKGGNVQKIKYGFQKLTKDEAQSGKFGPRGLRIAKIPECTPIIKEICGKVKDLENYRSYGDIAQWLEESGVPTGPYCPLGHWTGKLVASLVKDPILIGVRTFRKMVSQRIFETGRHKRLPNKEAPETETYPDLAHLSQEDFDEVQRFVKLRAANQKGKRGREHPRHNIPRSKSIFPAQHMRCGCCGQLFYPSAKGRYKCQCSFKKSFIKCWNHVEVDGPLVRERIVRWLLQQLGQFPQFRERTIEVATTEFERLQSRQGQDSNLWEQRVTTLEREAGRLARAIAKTDGVDALIDELQNVNQQLAKARQARDAGRNARIQRGEFLSRADIENRLEAAMIELASTSFQFADFLRKILIRFEIKPVQAVDTGMVRPRAYVTLAFAVPSPMTGGANTVHQIDGVIDLFDPPTYVAHLASCLKAKQQSPNRSLNKIAKDLGINLMTVKRAMDFAKLMEREGFAEPYRELHEPPMNASRWKLA